MKKSIDIIQRTMTISHRVVKFNRESLCRDTTARCVGNFALKKKINIFSSLDVLIAVIDATNGQ